MGPACRNRRLGLLQGTLTRDFEMFTLRFKTKKAEGETQCEREVALLAASRSAGVELNHRCGGHARCGTCVVTVHAGADQLSEPLASEKRILAILKAGADQRLACQAWAKGDVSCEQA